MLCLLAAPAAVVHGDATILVVGDSLSAGHGMRQDESWVSLLQKRLNSKGYEYRVVNASISGDTTQGGRTRLPRALSKHKPALVIIELGGNDGLRGVPIEVSRGNLEAMIAASQDTGALVVVTGIRIPPNYGSTYVTRFQAIYDDLAKQYDLLLVPFFMRDVALDPDFMQPDGIHPNVRAQPILLDAVWSVLEPALAR